MRNLVLSANSESPTNARDDRQLGNRQKYPLLLEKTYKKVVKNTPLVSIDLILRNANRQVLLGLRINDPAKDYWFVPGGRISKNEPIRHAFETISKKEVGLSIGIETARFMGVFEHIYEENFWSDKSFGTHYVVLAYEIQVESSADKFREPQHRLKKWWNIDELLGTHDVHPLTKNYFREISEPKGNNRGE